ncbi:hypothetical protein ACOSP7_019642 [Xanthoceras sorbifolium]
MRNTENMEEGLLLVKEGGKGRREDYLNATFEQVKKLGCIAAPMVAANLSQYFLQVISTMNLGGELFLSSTAIATSFCAVTGFSLLISLLSNI